MSNFNAIRGRALKKANFVTELMTVQRDLMRAIVPVRDSNNITAKSQLKFISVTVFFLNSTPDPNIIPSPLPQPAGCRADTQIVCPDLKTRICEVERCDGVDNCPLEPGAAKAWDEENCVQYENVTFLPKKTTTTPSE